MDRMKLVHTPMGTSQMYKGNGSSGKGSGNGTNGKTKKRKDKDSEKGGDDEDSGKRRRGAKGKGKHSSTDSNHEVDRQAEWQKILGSTTQTAELSKSDCGPILETTETSKAECGSDPQNPQVASVFGGPQQNGEVRQVLWLDDMVSSCLRVVDFEFGRDDFGSLRLPKGLSESMVSRVISFYFSASLEFAWRKYLVLAGQTLKQWSRLRPALQELIRNAFVEMKHGSSLGGESGSTTGASGSAAAIVLGTNSNQAIVSRLLQLSCNQPDCQSGRDFTSHTIHIYYSF